MLATIYGIEKAEPFLTPSFFSQVFPANRQVSGNGITGTIYYHVPHPSTLSNFQTASLL